MANFNRKFGSNKVVKTEDDNDTPQQKKFERATGKDSDSAVGDVDKKQPVQKTDPRASGVAAPKGADKNVWAEAERAALGVSGGFSGVGEEGRRTQIQKHYDQMVENDKKDKAWAGDGKENGVLGEV